MNSRGLRYFLFPLLGVTFSAGGCLFDPDERCDGNEVFANGDRCVCREGHVRVDGACVPCGENERIVGGACECEAGLVRGSDGTCEELGTLGRDCDTESEPCEDASAGYCRPVDGTRGYCTIANCTTSEDCPGRFECDTAADPSYCKKPPSGLGEPCTEAGHCAGFEASYCEQLQSNLCLVPDCAPGGDDCFLGWSCCDLTSVGLPTLCVTEGTCPF
jgi:hypothetical protein